MIEFGEKVLDYTDGLDQEAFIAHGPTYDATLRNLQLIGEAATYIPDEVRQAHTEVPWHAIIGTRNRRVHPRFFERQKGVRLEVGEKGEKRKRGTR